MILQKISTIIEDNNPDNNWMIMKVDGNIAWAHLSTISKTNNVEFEESFLYEIDLSNQTLKKISILNEPYILDDLNFTEKYLYLTVIILEPFKEKKIFKVDRNSYVINEVFLFDSNYEMISICDIVDDKFVLLYVVFKEIGGEVLDKYEILDIESKETLLVYCNNEDMVDSKIFLTKSSRGVMAVVDLHVTPSDKHVSCGKADKVLIKYL